MNELVVISGKGGTGKTSVTAALAALAGGAVVVDCDVDASDLHLVLSPRVRRVEYFSGGKTARILPDRCTGCGMCRRVCRFEAVTGPTHPGNAFSIDPTSCEGCGVCVAFCPVEAIAFEDTVNGRWFIGETRFGPLVYAELDPGQENSGKLVSRVRREAKALAGQRGLKRVIADGSPGVGCPVIASITGADLVLIVTEPTPSGRHDLGRVADLVRHFDIPAVVCINKADLNPVVAEAIGHEAQRRSLPVLESIPYDPQVTAAQKAGQTIVEYGTGPAEQAVRRLWQQVSDHLKARAEA